MRPVPSTAYSPVKRFIIATLAGIAAPTVIVTVLALCFGHLPPLALLIGTLPLSTMFALLSSGSWHSLPNESKLTRWFVSMIIAVGITFEASVFLMWINNGQSSHFDTSFVIANTIWALTVWLTATAVSHRLSRPVKNSSL